jgi:hypothetical protein
MKLHAPIFVFAALATAGGAHAAPFLALGENAELFLTASATALYDDNIFLQDTGKEDDTIWNVAPGLDFRFGHQALTSGRFYYNENFLRYVDHSDLNTSLSTVGFTSAYDDGKSKLALDAGYRQLAQNEVTFPGQIVRRHVFDLSLSGELSLTEKVSVGVGGQYEHNEYGNSLFPNSDIWSVKADGYYAYSPKLSWSVGYRYRDSSFSGALALDSRDHFFNVGARGEFTPKLRGQVRVGYVLRDFSGGSNQAQLGVESGLTCAATEKTSCTLGLASDFGNAVGLGQSIKHRQASFSVDSEMDPQWSWRLGVSYRNIVYPVARTDDYVEGRAGIAYAFNAYLKFAASYLHRNNSSNVSGNKFSDNIFKLQADLRY